jgi:malonate decarboxylase gamma subunit
MDEESMIGRGREAIDMIFDSGSLQENVIGNFKIDSETGPGAVVGTVTMNGEAATVIANDAEEYNPRFPVVFAGVIGLEEGYKMAQAVYYSLESDQDKPVAQKRPIVLIVDTPGNGPGKVEEIMGMNKATGAYQLALAEARKAGHPIVAIVIGRAISGAFLCHGLQADHILSLSKEFGTMIHVMPLTSISRITKLDIEVLEELSLENPVFAAGVDFFHRLGGVNEVVGTLDGMKEAVARHIKEVRQLKASGQFEKLGPWGRGGLGAERGGRKTRVKVIAQMKQEFDAEANKYLNA